MPITRIDVCDLIHTRSEENLELSSSCSTVLAYNVTTGSVLDEVAAASKLPIFEQLWVQRNGRLRLSVTLVLDAISSNNQEKENFVSQLGINFTNAELWRQLGLQCSFSLPSNTDTSSEDSNKIDLMIFHSEITCTAAKGFKNHIIANTRPPDGVPTADLHEVSIIWALSSIISSSFDRDSKRLNGGTLIGNTDEIMSFFEEKDIDGHVSLSQPSRRLPSWDTEPHHTWPSSMTVASGTDEQILDGVADEDQEMSIVSRLSAQPSPIEILQQRQPLHMRQKRPRSISSPLFDPSAAQKMIDVAFHEIISGRNISDLSKVSQAKVVARPKLAEISPALFSPGYLQAMSRQSQCICTIAYSMASVNSRTTSKPVKDAFALLWDTGSDTYSFNGGPPSPEVQAHVEGLASIIKARTWMIMQRLLFEPAAAARLKPLSCSVSQGVEKPLKILHEYSSPVTLIETPENFSSPATDILDDFCLLDEDSESLLEESDQELLLDEYDVDPSIWENISSQKSYASSHGLSARLPMSQRYHPGSYVADEQNTKARNNRTQSEFLDVLDVSGSDVGEPRDTDSPFEALDTPAASSIGCTEQADILSDLDAKEILLDDLSNDDGTISNREEFLDTMEMLDHLSVDDGRAGVDEVDSEPDEMLDTLDLDDETGKDWLGPCEVLGS
ncbi:hypothetical protein MMC17_006170 [Xylographa soralifera]|nr:hypothetical protein [Xylographa soralifera]